MKTFLSILILTISSIAYGQPIGQDTSYCMPVRQARLIFEDAVRSFTLDSIVNQQDQIILIQRTAYEELDASFNRETSLLNDKYTKQKENTGHMERLAMSYKDERDYYQKLERKRRRKKNVLTYTGLILLGIIIVK